MQPALGPFQLSEQDIVAFVATRDPARANQFYGGTLGLPLVEEQLPFALVFDAHGIKLRVAVVKELAVAPYTVLGWEVPDIVAAVKALQSAGVHFEHFPGVPQDELGIWTAPNGNAVAWFKDPDGNTLSISHH